MLSLSVASCVATAEASGVSCVTPLEASIAVLSCPVRRFVNGSSKPLRATAEAALAPLWRASAHAAARAISKCNCSNRKKAQKGKAGGSRLFKRKKGVEIREAERLKEDSGMGVPDDCNILSEPNLFVPLLRPLSDKTAPGLAQAFSGGTALRIPSAGSIQS